MPNNADDIAHVHSSLQQAEQELEQAHQFEAQTVSLQAEVASLQEECTVKASQVHADIVICRHQVSQLCMHCCKPAVMHMARYAAVVNHTFV